MQLFCEKVSRESSTKHSSELKSFCLFCQSHVEGTLPRQACNLFSFRSPHLKGGFLSWMLKTPITNANLWTSSVSPHFECKEAVQNVPVCLYSEGTRTKVTGWSFQWWKTGMSHLLFPLISLENLVKKGRYSSEPVSLPVAQIPHCFHSCLTRRMRLKVGGGPTNRAAAINSCVKMRNEKQKG